MAGDARDCVWVRLQDHQPLGVGNRAQRQDQHGVQGSTFSSVHGVPGHWHIREGVAQEPGRVHFEDCALIFDDAGNAHSWTTLSPLTGKAKAFFVISHLSPQSRRQPESGPSAGLDVAANDFKQAGRQDDG